MSDDHSQCVSLKEHVDRIFSEKDKALSAALLAVEKANAAALVAVQKENLKTEAAAEKRFELLNELRSNVATKDALAQVQKVQESLVATRDNNMGKSAGFSQTWGLILGALGLIGTLLGIAGAILAFAY